MRSDIGMIVLIGPKSGVIRIARCHCRDTLDVAFGCYQSFSGASSRVG